MELTIVGLTAVGVTAFLVSKIAAIGTSFVNELTK